MNFIKQERVFGKDITNVLRNQRFPTFNIKKLNPAKKYASYEQSQSLKPQTQMLSINPVDHYVKDIYEHIINKEISEITVGNYFTSDCLATKEKRCEAIAWLIDAHRKYQLFQQTLFMAVWIFDKCFGRNDFMSKINHSSSNLSVTALYMASKYEQTYRIPKLRDLLVLRGSFTPQKDILAIEGMITELLSFNLIFQSSLKYLEMLASQSNMTEKNLSLAKYILELSLLEPHFLQQKQSLLGCGVYYLVSRVRKVQEPWPFKLQKITHYSERDLQKIASALFTIFQNVDNVSGSSIVKKKFLSKNFHEVANLRIQRRKSLN